MPTAAALLHDQMTWRRVRVASGLVMFTYLTLHLVMHALGIVSFDAMQWGTRIHELLWRNPLGTVVLYGAFAIHFSLALYALYARRSFRMGSDEWVRLALGFAIVPLIIHHFVAGRYTWSAFDAVRRYDVVLNAFFVVTPFNGWRQVLTLLVAWAHGCIGIHIWLRQRRGYGRYVPALLALAVLMPTLALLGVYNGTRELIARQTADPSVQQKAAAAGRTRDPVIRQRVDDVKDVAYWTYTLLLLGVFAARGVRWAIERKHGFVRITYPSGREVSVPAGFPVLEASRRARIPHASICGGRGRCTTCRVRVLRGIESVPPPKHFELAALARLRAGPNVRLACQLRPRGDIAVLPLLPADVGPNDARRTRDAASMERFVAIMFVDIRCSTALFEHRMPYDVVFLLNHYFDAVAGAVVTAGGAPNQFIGDGVMAIFGTRSGRREACAEALAAARGVRERLDEMNRRLRDELREPIAVGMGIHAGRVILGEVGYGDRFLLTAIGDTVNVAARLQDLTKEHRCELVVSQAVADIAQVDLSMHPSHDVSVRERAAPPLVRAVDIKLLMETHPRGGCASTLK